METIGRDLKEMQRTPLEDRHVALLHENGENREFAAGDFIVRPGDPMDQFLYVLEGEVEIVDPHTDQRSVSATLGPTQFIGEITFLNGGNHYLPMRAAKDTKVLSVPRKRMLELMSQTPEMSDIIITVFTARRRRLLEEQQSGLTLVGVEEDPEIQKLAFFAERNRLPFQCFALGSEEANNAAKLCGIEASAPFVVFGRDQVLENPTPRNAADLMGLNLSTDLDEVDVIIVGAGPSGVAAAVYAGAEGLSAIVVEDTAIGGQAGTSSRIENYMGFPTGISGADLVWRGGVQALKFGTQFVMPRRVEKLEHRADKRFCVSLDDGQELCSKAVIVSTGVQYRRLPIDDLDVYDGAGVYYAATESEARFCRDGEVFIVGGGNSAGQAAMFLSRVAKHVHLLVRSNSLASSMSSYLSSRLEAENNITIHFHTEVAALHGDGERLSAITLKDSQSGDTRDAQTSGLFIMAGAAPFTDWLKGMVDLDEKGFVKTGEQTEMSPYETSLPGVFAVGDVRSGSVKRVASAVGEGSVVISRVWEHVKAKADA